MIKFTYLKVNLKEENISTLDYKTGKKLEDIGNDSKSINILREKGESKKNFNEYLFPEPVELSINNSFFDIIHELKAERNIAGKINYIELNNLLLTSFHEVLPNGNFRNIFRIVEIESNKVILEEILDKETKLLIPESFFVINKLVFLIKEKIKLIVYSF